MIECFRCEEKLHESEVMEKHGESYCEHCYGDLFISWEQAYAKNKNNVSSRDGGNS